MIQSMTGFGKAEGEVNFGSVEITIQSVNNRFFAVRCHLPELLQDYQLAIEKHLKKRLKRGSIAINIRVKTDEQPQIKINFEIAQFYATQISQLLSELNTDEFLISEQGGELNNFFIRPDMSVGELLNLPLVVEQQENTHRIDEKTFAEILELIDAAIAELKKMRIEEGQTIYEDFEMRLAKMQKTTEFIEKRKDEMLTTYQQKLKTRLNDLLVDATPAIKEADLARELAIYAERSDITEEILRLQHHIKQFYTTTKTADETLSEVGRKLDFITQEMLREVNTIASKTASVQISSAAVELKTEIEKLKEQAQNVL